MALPIIGITTTLVGTTLGVATRNVGNLFLHEVVNEWGFNIPGTGYQNNVWGKNVAQRKALSPLDANYTPPVNGVEPGYHIGYFRGYDHDWVVYSPTLGSAERSGYTSVDIPIGLARPPILDGKPIPSPLVYIQFKIEYSRLQSDFDSGKATLITDTSFAGEGSPWILTINGASPPDFATNGKLNAGATFYIRITPINPPERRLITNSPIDSAYVMVTDTTPSDYKIVRNFVIIASKYPGFEVFSMYATLNANQAGFVTVVGKMANTPDFSGVVSTSGTQSVNIATPSDGAYIADVSFDFTSFMNTGTIVGDIVYGRIEITGWGGNGGSAVVTDELPPRD